MNDANTIPDSSGLTNAQRFELDSIVAAAYGISKRYRNADSITLAEHNVHVIAQQVERLAYVVAEILNDRGRPNPRPSATMEQGHRDTPVPDPVVPLVRAPRPEVAREPQRDPLPAADDLAPRRRTRKRKEVAA